MVKNPDELAQSVKELYASAISVQTTAAIQANLGQQTMDYTIRYEDTATLDGAHSAVLTVLKPDSVAGITASIAGEDFAVQYEDTELETALPDRKGMTPVDVVTYLLEDLKNSVPTSVWLEEDGVLGLRYEATTDECACAKEVFLATEGGSLKSARIYCNGTQILQCSFEDFSMSR